ncbi:MAG: hypothetical protein F6K47_34010 [Symploca sp. SIO2E6]|nr:hypothetical protein [Symploca sp. SIO2E6]
MLQSYEAIIENGQLQWLRDQPQISKARVIVTILSETQPQLSYRTPSIAIAGKGKTLGDVVSSFVQEQDTEQSILEILAKIHSQRDSGRSREEINRDLQAERNAWDS